MGSCFFFERFRSGILVAVLVIVVFVIAVLILLFLLLLVLEFDRRGIDCVVYCMPALQT